MIDNHRIQQLFRHVLRRQDQYLQSNLRHVSSLHRVQQQLMYCPDLSIASGCQLIDGYLFDANQCLVHPKHRARQLIQNLSGLLSEFSELHHLKVLRPDAPRKGNPNQHLVRIPDVRELPSSLVQQFVLHEHSGRSFLRTLRNLQ